MTGCTPARMRFETPTALALEAGETENRIKDFKLALRADRLSCHRFLANQFRLLMHAAAYWLLDVLRSILVKAGVERLQLDTLRLILIKIGGCVLQLATKVRLHLASGHPGQSLWDAQPTLPRPVSSTPLLSK